MADKHLGQLSFVRIYSGSIKAGSYAYNRSRVATRELMRMHANKREDIEDASAGEIIAIGGMKQVTTGDTVCDENKPVILEKMEFPAPVIRVAVEPKTRQDQDKLGVALNRSRRKIRRSMFQPIRKPDRRSSPVWVSCTRDHRRSHEARVWR